MNVRCDGLQAFQREARASRAGERSLMASSCASLYQDREASCGAGSGFCRMSGSGPNESATSSARSRCCPSAEIVPYWRWRFKRSDRLNTCSTVGSAFLPWQETFFLWGPRQTGKTTLLHAAYRTPCGDLLKPRSTALSPNPERSAETPAQTGDPPDRHRRGAEGAALLDGHTASREPDRSTLPSAGRVPEGKRGQANLLGGRPFATSSMA